MTTSIKSIIVLVTICTVLALALGAVNLLTAPMIEKQEVAATNAALREVYPQGESFTEIDLSKYDGLPSSVTDIYEADDGGYAVKLLTTGYSSNMIILCGISSDGTVTGATCISSGETLGYEKTYGASLVGAKLDSIDSVDTVSGATKTTKAYRAAVKDAIGAVVIIQGGSFDNRSPEEISLDVALPSGEGDFEGLFFAENIPELTKIFKAVNDSGYVFVFGDVYVGISSDGTVVGGAETKYASLVKNYLNSVNSTVYNDIGVDFSSIPEIRDAKITASGNYVFTVQSDGFASLKNGSPVIVKLALSQDGRIISCVTVYQEETEGYGAECASPYYYTKFNGKTEEDYNTVDEISAATVTTNAYMHAVSRAFDALKLARGGS